MFIGRDLKTMEEPRKGPIRSNPHLKKVKGKKLCGIGVSKKDLNITSFIKGDLPLSKDA